MGLRDWESVSVGSLGLKLWRWLRFADGNVLSKRREDLIHDFALTYSRAGGPLLDLDDLNAHFLLAGALESVELLSAVPEIYRCWPKSQWNSISGLRDKRLLGQSLGQGSLCLCLKSVVNIALVLSSCDIVELLRQVTPLIFYTSVHLTTPSEKMSTGPWSADVFAGIGSAEGLVCRLPAGFPIVGTGQRAISEQDRLEFVEIKQPMHGWVLVGRVVAEHLCAELTMSEMAATSGILERMYHCRRQYTGNSPVGMSAISSMKLRDTLEMYDEMFQILQKFGRGSCQVTHGAFLVDPKPHSWRPRGYEDWAHHSFVLFDDGTIADVTADQFDPDLPQLWWPADPARYALNDAKADSAETARRGHGLDRWTQLVEGDPSIAPGIKQTRWWMQDRRSLLLAGASSRSTAASPSPMPMLGPGSGEGETLVRGSLTAAPPAVGSEGCPAVLLRNGRPLSLPPVTRHVDVGKGRQAARFRRVTGKGELDVWLLDELFGREELRRLVKLCEARSGFQPSLQTSRTGQQVQDGRRTSHSCAVHWPMLFGGNLEELQERGLELDVLAELKAAQEISEVCARAVGVDVSHIEPLQLVKYTPGQFYRAHMDTHKEPDRLSSHMGEQRTHTLLVFVVDVPADDGGGYLHFPRLGLRILPRAGWAVLWRNVHAEDGKIDAESLHEGEPPLHADKVAMNVWIADRPFTKELVEEGRLRKQRLAREAEERAAKEAPAPKQEPLLLRKLRQWQEQQDERTGDGPARKSA